MVDIEKWEKFLRDMDKSRPFCYPAMEPRELAYLIACYKDCLEHDKAIAKFSAMLRDPDSGLEEDVREALKNIFDEVFPESRGN